MPDQASGDILFSYRLELLEKGQKEMRGELKEATGSLAGGLAALQAQISTYQINLYEKYELKKDADELRDRVEALADQNTNHGWMVAAAAMGAAASAVVAAIGWFRPMH